MQMKYTQFHRHGGLFFQQQKFIKLRFGTHLLRHRQRYYSTTVENFFYLLYALYINSPMYWRIKIPFFIATCLSVDCQTERSGNTTMLSTKIALEKISSRMLLFLFFFVVVIFALFSLTFSENYSILAHIGYTPAMNHRTEWEIFIYKYASSNIMVLIMLFVSPVLNFYDSTTQSRILRDVCFI